MATELSKKEFLVLCHGAVREKAQEKGVKVNLENASIHCNQMYKKYLADEPPFNKTLAQVEGEKSQETRASLTSRTVDGADRKISALAKERAKKDGVCFDTALSRVAKENPELLADWLPSIEHPKDGPDVAFAKVMKKFLNQGYSVTKSIRLAREESPEEYEAYIQSFSV